MTPEEALGRVIAAVRTLKGMKRKDLSTSAGLSYPFIAEIENGVKEPSLASLRQIAHALGTSASYLLSAAEQLLSE